MTRIVLHARARLDLAYDPLDGLSVGDALGAQFFMVGQRAADDTEMACNLITELRDHGGVDRDRLAATFA